MSSRRSGFSAIAVTVMLGGASLVATTSSGCSSDDETAPAVDASLDNASFDADPCSTYTAVGKACNIPKSRICFAQCQTGGCFCENGAWACRTDTSCYRDGSPLDELDANTTVSDSAVDAAATDASLDAPKDATDAG